ncbi:hypothetical protein ACFV4E_24265 [Streptomyces hygroscopicus]|uniref:Suppressor of fused domain protein n=1 Tax=Streptomyces demainii TaxID=588122 RepID=A0ABT9KLV4_9ACTN|nr:hypothetical protein [Streptomyces demainii]MDP9608421.1 hypothetical protein [Streptomyces demainii]
MALTYDDIAEQQADIVRLLLHHIHAPLPDGRFIRGVLPSPPPAAEVRIVTGPQRAQRASAPDDLMAWEIPLRTIDDPEELAGPNDVLGIVRALNTGTQIFSSSRVDTVMGMTLIHVDPAQVAPVGPGDCDNAFTILRTLTYPWTEEQPDPRLRGFLLQGPDRMRLYVDHEEDTDVVAADVRPSGALTALLAALPSLIEERERMVRGDIADPHCSRLINLVDW